MDFRPPWNIDGTTLEFEKRADDSEVVWPLSALFTSRFATLSPCSFAPEQSNGHCACMGMADELK